MADPVARLQSALADRYVFERELGRGGMATVYLTSDLKHERKVAVKVLRPELVAAVSRERFQREISIVAHLTHPHILPLYDSGVVEDTCFFVMPYVKGETLRTRLDREGQLPIEEALGIASQVADALAYAHSQNIVHRDIKPQNIMLESGHALVADFGIAMITDDLPVARLTETGFSLGTPHYMSPEQGSAAPRIDGRTDIYSLGCVLYEMLTGTPPFSGANVYAIMARHAAEPPPSIRLVRQTVSEFLEGVTFRALAKSPADRYRTAEEFVRALTEVAHERVRETGPGRAPSPTFGTQHDDLRPAGRKAGDDAGSPAPRSRTYLAIAAAGLLLPTAIGFLNTTIYDVKLKVPSLYTPTRLDFPVIGVRALIPGIYVALMILIGYVLAKYMLRLVVALLSRSAPIRNTLDGWQRRSATTWTRLLGRGMSATVAEVWFIAAIGASALVLAPFAPFLGSLANDETELLSCSARSVHTGFTIATTALIAVLAVSWSKLFGYLRGRGGSGFSTELVRWGGLAWIITLVLVMTSPWLLLWGENPRARMDGERVYIIQERETDLLLYNFEKGITEHLSVEAASSLQRLGTPGYIFEGPRLFDDQAPRC